MALLRRVNTYNGFDSWRALYEGQLDGKIFQSFNIPARRSAFSTTTELEDIAEYLTTPSIPEPTGAQSWEVVSSSANDAAAGTGTRTVEVHYLDNSWLSQTTTVTLNGTTPVAIAAMANCRAINWLHSKTVGSGGKAAGNIDLRVAGGGAIHERITAGGNQSLSSLFTVPEGYYAVTDRWGAGVSTNHSQDFRLRATCERDSRDLLEGVYLFQDQIVLDNATHSREISPLLFKPRTRIKVSAISGSLAAIANSSFNVHLVQI